MVILPELFRHKTKQATEFNGMSGTDQEAVEAPDTAIVLVFQFFGKLESNRTISRAFGTITPAFGFIKF